MTTIGGNIAKVRDILGITQTALARSVNTSQSAISSIESGDRNPSFGMVLRIKHALGCSWNGLLKDIE